jgi:hypothetical protein
MELSIEHTAFSFPLRSSEYNLAAPSSEVADTEYPPSTITTLQRALDVRADSREIVKDIHSMY